MLPVEELLICAVRKLVCMKMIFAFVRYAREVF